MPKNLYELLELNAEQELDVSAIRKQYKKMALKWHPDKNPENRAAAEQHFQQLQEAYEFLINASEEQRKAYQKWCHSQAHKESNSVHEEIASFNQRQHSQFQQQAKTRSQPEPQQEARRQPEPQRRTANPSSPRTHFERKTEKAGFFPNGIPKEMPQGRYHHYYEFTPKEDSQSPLRDFYLQTLKEIETLLTQKRKAPSFQAQERGGYSPGHFNGARPRSFIIETPPKSLYSGFQINMIPAKSSPHIVIIANRADIDRLIVQLLVSSLIRESQSVLNERRGSYNREEEQLSRPRPRF